MTPHSVNLGQARLSLADSLLRSKAFPAERAARRRHAAFYEELWTAAAGRVGAQVRPLGDGALEIDLGARTVRIRATHCSIDDEGTLLRAGDKELVHRLLRAADLPTPRYARFTLGEVERAEAFLAEAAGPCVVKPARGSSGGAGVTTGIRTVEDLHRAAADAAAAGARAGRSAAPGGITRGVIGRFGSLAGVPLLVEDQLAGDNYRLLYVDGILVDALRRAVPTVVGDGAATVDELLARLNASRAGSGTLGGQKLVARDMDVERTLDTQGLHLQSVPAAGREVLLKTKINEGDPADNRPARGELHRSIIADGAAAAAAVGVRWAGVDVITADATRPLADTGGAVLEVNTTPGLAAHFHGRPGEVNPADRLLAYLAAREVTGLPGVGPGGGE